MVINGGSRRYREWWARHLQNAEHNERVTLVETRGLLSTTIDDALREMEAVALGTRCANYLYHANLNPQEDEFLTPEQWEQSVDALEHNLGYDGLARFVVEHAKKGRVHRHAVWSRIDPETMTARPDSWNFAVHERTARELEEAFGLEPGRSVLVADRGYERPERRPKNWEVFRGQESGIDPRQVAEQVRKLYAQAEDGQSFARALDTAGYILCRGDQRVYCILDRAGHEHSLGRRLGVKAAALKAFMKDVDLERLPSMAQARALYRSRKGRDPGGGRSAGGGE